MASDTTELFIIDIEYIKPIEVIEALIKDHMAWLDRGYADGIFLASGRKDPRTGGIIIATGAKREDIEKRASDDPFVVNGAAKTTITRFLPSRFSEGFQELFANAG